MTRQDCYVQVASLTTTNKVGGKRHTEAQSLSQVPGLEMISANIEKERTLLLDG